MHNHDECNKDTPGKYFFFLLIFMMISACKL
jgi:hypothetical protein